MGPVDSNDAVSVGEVTPPSHVHHPIALHVGSAGGEHHKVDMGSHGIQHCGPPIR